MAASRSVGATWQAGSPGTPSRRHPGAASGEEAAAAGDGITGGTGRGDPSTPLQLPAGHADAPDAEGSSQPGVTPTELPGTEFLPTAPGVSPKPPENIEHKFEKDFTQHLQKRNFAKRWQLGAVGGVVGGVIGVAASPVLLPGLAVAAMIGTAAGYQGAKRMGKEELKRQGQALRRGDVAEPETSGHGPPLRRLRYLVKWGHWQLLEYEEAPIEWRAAVLDEIFRAFSPWVQRVHLLRAKGQMLEDNPEAREVFAHLAPLYYLLQRRAAVDAIAQTVEHLAEAFANDTADAGCEERCRVGFPTVLETISSMDRLSKGAQAQLHREPPLPLAQAVVCLAPQAQHHPLPPSEDWQESQSKCDSSGAPHSSNPRSARRHRLQRIVDSVRKVLENPDVQEALQDRKRFAQRSQRERLSPKRLVSPGPADSDDEEGTKKLEDEGLVVPPEGIENELEEEGVEEVSLQEEYFSVSEESGDEAKKAGKSLRAETTKQGIFEERSSMLPRGDGEKTWNSFDPSMFDVRAKSYLLDRKKAPSADAMLELVHLDFLLVPPSGPVWRTTEHADFYPTYHRRKGDKRFLFVQNWVFPPFQCVIVGALNPEAAWFQDPFSPQARVWRKFLEAEEAERKDLFKVIMSLEQGPWLVKRAVPKKPVLIGRKVKISSYHEPGQYLEMVLDVASSKPEQVAVGMVCGALRRLQLNFVVLIESREEEELPETVLVTATASMLDPSNVCFPKED